MGMMAALQRRAGPDGSSGHAVRARARLANLQDDIEALDVEAQGIQARIDERQSSSVAAAGIGIGDAEKRADERLPSESKRDHLIRTGKITPFSKLAQAPPRASANLAEVMLDAEVDKAADDYDGEVTSELAREEGPVSHRNLLAPGFTSIASADETEDSGRRRKRRRGLSSLASSSPGSDADDRSEQGAVDDLYEDEGEEDATALDTAASTGGAKRLKRRRNDVADDEAASLAGLDDGDEHVYMTRLRGWCKRRRAARRAHQRSRRATSHTHGGEGTDGTGVDENDDDNDYDDDDYDDKSNIDGDEDNQKDAEWHRPHPTRPDTELEGGLRVPGDIYPALFGYQKTGVRWLWELYSQRVGGIIGDEMGLGKTIQAIAFLAALHHSKKLNKPVLVVCPATVMQQWVNEFHRWWPPMRVSILHGSGSGMVNLQRERQAERSMESQTWDGSRSRMSKSQRAADRIVRQVIQDGHVLVTTYTGLQIYAEFLIPTQWEYVVLDEGHKIRNPNAAVTIYCKELQTPNRVILSGTPMQNNLQELWSLFDFVFPMRLGTLVNFRQQFEFPIRQGGYANASNLQVETAMKCAETLKDTISAYLLQRFKADVAADLPKKTERVLFCKLTKVQREAYETFLESEELKAIVGGKRNALYGVDILRKICNHPDLQEHRLLSQKSGYNYGSGAKSGKMQVVKALLEIWKRQGHKTLLFAQHRIMLDIMEKFICGLSGFSYRRMDGTTSIKGRQDLVDEFNGDPSLHVFLLTTKVGGLGINLTGADRVIIYDPDWNPSTDVQARERAWRLGQKREVEIYRLMCAGTIEEKIYHRQIFKQFLTNKILKDPKQRQTFQFSDLHDLFTLGEANDGETETGSIFQGSKVQFPQSGRSGAEAVPDPASSGPLAGPAKQPDGAETANELSAVAGVSRLEPYQTRAAVADGEGESGPDGPGSTSAKSDVLLTTIFARSGVHSALEHDAILASNSWDRKSSKITPDPEIIAREARRVADEAARELQRAGEIARTIPAGTPTWTGLVGTAGRPADPATRHLLASSASASSMKTVITTATSTSISSPVHPSLTGNTNATNTATTIATTTTTTPNGNHANGMSSGSSTGIRTGIGSMAALGRGSNPSSTSVLANLASRQFQQQGQRQQQQQQQQERAHGGTGPGGTAPVSTARSTLGATATPTPTTNSAGLHQPRGKDFLLLIRDFLLAHGGSVYTQMLVDHFSRFCNSPVQTAEFREMLRKIATLERRAGTLATTSAAAARNRPGRGIGTGTSTGRSKWVLRDEFKPTA